MVFISGLAGVALSCSSLGGLQGDLEVAALLTLLLCHYPHVG